MMMADINFFNVYLPALLHYIKTGALHPSSFYSSKEMLIATLEDCNDVHKFRIIDELKHLKGEIPQVSSPGYLMSLKKTSFPSSIEARVIEVIKEVPDEVIRASEADWDFPVDLDLIITYIKTGSILSTHYGNLKERLMEKIRQFDSPKQLEVASTILSLHADPTNQTKNAVLTFFCIPVTLLNEEHVEEVEKRAKEVLTFLDKDILKLATENYERDNLCRVM